MTVKDPQKEEAISSMGLLVSGDANKLFENVVAICIGLERC